MSDAKLYNMIDALIDRTQRKSISWEVTAWGDRFVTALGNYSVIISMEDAVCHLSIQDEFNDIIESVSSMDLLNYSADAMYKMNTLHSVARRNARGADKAIDDILGFLK